MLTKLCFNPLKADVYSLGITFTELLTQQRTTPRNKQAGFSFNAESFMQQLTQRFSFASSSSNYTEFVTNGQCPPYLLNAVLPCLDNNPAQRPTADALLNNLAFAAKEYVTQLAFRFPGERIQLPAAWPSATELDRARTWIQPNQNTSETAGDNDVANDALADDTCDLLPSFLLRSVNDTINGYNDNNMEDLVPRFLLQDSLESICCLEDNVRTTEPPHPLESIPQRSTETHNSEFLGVEGLVRLTPKRKRAESLSTRKVQARHKYLRMCGEIAADIVLQELLETPPSCPLPPFLFPT